MFVGKLIPTKMIYRTIYGNRKNMDVYVVSIIVLGGCLVGIPLLIMIISGLCSGDDEY